MLQEAAGHAKPSKYYLRRTLGRFESRFLGHLLFGGKRKEKRMRELHHKTPSSLNLSLQLTPTLDLEYEFLHYLDPSNRARNRKIMGPLLTKESIDSYASVLISNDFIFSKKCDISSACVRICRAPLPRQKFSANSSTKRTYHLYSYRLGRTKTGSSSYHQADDYFFVGVNHHLISSHGINVE